MENTQQPNSLFEFGIDNEAKNHLLETARWAKFLAVVGIISLILMLILSIVMGAFMGKLASSYSAGAGAISGGAITLLYLVIIALYVYPVYALYKFATTIKPALLSGDQGGFNAALGYLKGMFKYIGVMTLVLLSLYGIILIFAMIAAMMR